MEVKQRLDQLLVEQGLVETRTKAQAMIMAGQVSTEKGESLTKPGTQLPADTVLEVARSPRYVSRGGEKLASVAAELDLDFAGRVVLDVGSSTGGFTDYALQHGAAKVYCVDVGRGQLAYKLRQDPRVVAMEQTDIRSLSVIPGPDRESDPPVKPEDDPKVLPEQPDVALIDVSFISLRQVLLHVAELVKSGSPIVAMLKPQFEAGRALADKNAGIIKDQEERDQVLADFRGWVNENFEIIKEADSALSGAKGNVERFFVLKRRSL